MRRDQGMREAEDMAAPKVVGVLGSFNCEALILCQQVLNRGQPSGKSFWIRPKTKKQLKQAIEERWEVKFRATSMFDAGKEYTNRKAREGEMDEASWPPVGLELIVCGPDAYRDRRWWAQVYRWKDPKTNEVKWVVK